MEIIPPKEALEGPIFRAGVKDFLAGKQDQMDMQFNYEYAAGWRAARLLRELKAAEKHMEEME